MYCTDAQPTRDRTAATTRPAPIRICIVGGGFGGLYTALALRGFSRCRSQPCEITLVEPKERFLFTPLLYEVVTGELQPWEIAPTYRQLLAGSSIRRCQSTVRTVDLASRQVCLEAGAVLNYDYLVLAVGGATRLGTIPGAATCAYPFRSLEDAEHLRERLRFLEASGRSPIRIAIAGSGPNGVELACKLADRLGPRGQVRLIERGDRILKTFNSKVRTVSLRALQQRRVQLDLNTDITQIDTESLTLRRRDQLQTVAADLVLWTAGTQMLDWVRALPCPHNLRGQLLAQPTLQLASHPEVFVLGDLAEIATLSHPSVPATAQAAFQQATWVARNLQAAIAGKPLQVFRYLHLGDMLTLGTDAAVVSSFGLTLQGRLAQLVRQGVYLQRLPTLRHRLRVLGAWMRRAIAPTLPQPMRRWGRRVWRRTARRQRVV